MLILTETGGALGETKRYVSPAHIESIDPVDGKSSVVIMATGAKHIVLETQSTVAKLKAAWESSSRPTKAYAVQWIGKITWQSFDR